VNIYGNVTFEGELVEEGLVGLQLQDPNNRTVALRTVPANRTPSQSWSIEITSVLPTDYEGNPQNSFVKGNDGWFKISLKNNDPFGSKNILLVITLCDFDSTPFRIHWVEKILAGGETLTEMVRLSISAYDGGDWVSTGNATVYANVFTDWPVNGGYPYSPEKSAVFTITSTSGAISTSTISASQAMEDNYHSYEVSIRLPPQAPLGIYTITASAYYQGFNDAFNTVVFSREYEMLGDILYNRKIDIYDIVVAATAYGTQGGSTLWNPEADLTSKNKPEEADGKVDLYDVVYVTGKYGTTY